MLEASILNQRLTHSCSSPEGICIPFAQQREREKENETPGTLREKICCYRERQVPNFSGPVVSRVLLPSMFTTTTSFSIALVSLFMTASHAASASLRRCSLFTSLKKIDSLREKKEEERSRKRLTKAMFCPDSQCEGHSVSMEKKEKRQPQRDFHWNQGAHLLLLCCFRSRKKVCLVCVTDTNFLSFFHVDPVGEKDKECRRFRCRICKLL